MKAVGDLKYCPNCKLTRELAWFSKNKYKPDGLDWCCKQCARVKKREYIARNKAMGRIVLTGSKVCTKCKETKDINMFTADYNTSDGRRSWCNACNTAQTKERYWKNIELSRERGRENSHNYYWKSDGRLMKSLKRQAAKGYS